MAPMRWLVEVSSIGKTDVQKFCVDAESWQKALQSARAQRGEEGPMSGFSIELLEEGYRAVDPVARVRFVVKRAPDDAPLTAPAPPSGPTEPRMTPPPTSSATATSTATSKKNAPRPPSAASGSASGLIAAAQPASEGKKKAQTMTFGSKGDAAVAAAKEKPAPPAAPAIGTALPGMPPVKLLTSREQDPTDASPLTYREYAFAVPPGTSETAAADVLRAQLRLVEAHIASAKTGKLVNLAVFDVEFKGKPPKKPIATLAWKDWKGEPILAYPARSPSNAPPQPAKKPEPPPAASAKKPEAPKPAVPDTVPEAFPAPQPKPVEAAPPPPPPPPVVAAPSPPPAPHTAPLPEPRAKAPSNPAEMVRTPSGRFVRGRQSGDELITSLFEAMHDLHFLRDALDGGQFCLALAMEVLPAKAGLIHFFDIDKREWVVACTRGKDTQRLLTTRAPESDDLLRAAARSRRAVVTASAAAEATSERYQQIGGAKSLIVAPIMQAGRALGAIEIINPVDGLPFTDNEGNAMTYIAEQYAEYLGSRGIVLDRDRIQSAAAAR